MKTMRRLEVCSDALLRRWNRYRFRHLDVNDQRIIVLHEPRALYFPIPKVACSSLEAACADILGIEVPSDEWKPDVFRSPRYRKLIHSRGGVVSFQESEQLSGYWKFAFVRNPWDRLVSCYSEKVREGDADHFIGGLSKVLVPYGMFWGKMSFDDFVRGAARIPDEVADGHLRSQHTFVADAAGGLKVDFLGRFENLAGDFQQVAEKLKVRVTLPHLLASKRHDYRDYYSADTRRRVAKRYARDIEMFDYVF